MIRLVIWFITFIGGLYFLAEFMLPETIFGYRNPLTRVLPEANNIVIIISAMAFLLGPLNLIRSHANTILKHKKGWIESIVFVVFIGIGATIQWMLRNEPENQYYDMLIRGLMFGFGASSMALLAFYLVSAAYRSFRLGSVESAVMMVAAFVVLLGKVPLGDVMTSWLPEEYRLSAAATWILMVPNTAVQRAVLIGAAGGAFTAGLRHWLGLGKQTR